MKRILVAVAALSLAELAYGADAAALWASKCQACHGKDGKPTTAGQRMGAPNVTTLKTSEADMAASIANGKGKMPAYKDKLSPEEIKALAKFVKNGLK
jgi:cytochrome c6